MTSSRLSPMPWAEAFAARPERAAVVTARLNVWNVADGQLARLTFDC